jgi:argininosuccinate lyase
MMAAGLAVALAREGLPFRRAHALVGSIVAEADRTTESVATVAGRVLPAHSPAVASRLEAVFDPTSAVRAKDVRGGTAPDAVRKSLDAARARVEIPPTPR